MTLPRRLRAPAPGWTADSDVVVVGSGIAGLSTALHISRQSSLRVMVVTKDLIAAGSTRWAQGGIAAALGAGDSPEQHFADTILAGGGICDEAAVRVLVREGPAAVRELAQIGARFDRGRDGGISLTREGGHRRDRIAHAGGDATGAEIERALVTRVLDAEGVEVLEHALVLDLLLDSAGAIAGLTLHVMGEGQRDGVGAVSAQAVVLATGGIGQVFASTTNPSVSTGDGVAAALRAGALVRDLEFVQFHPTVAWLGSQSRGQQPLVSEAVRGEGAFLVDDAGVRFMQGQHELDDLAPRDVVAKAIVRRMARTHAEHVWLDARGFGAEKWRVRFPTIHASLLSHGIDPVHDLIPVVPASHYASGGVRTDLRGQSCVPGLFACGEAACTGVHGANRLASNSLLEGLVFGRRIADTIMAGVAPSAGMGDFVPQPGAPVHQQGRPQQGGLVGSAARPHLQQLMSREAGVLRDLKGLDDADRGLAALAADFPGEPDTESWEATNLLTVASVLVHAARLREETRGSHWRDDFPATDDEQWRGHLDIRLLPDGGLHAEFDRTAKGILDPSAPEKGDGA
ncbi:MAG: L-aspartate oxidase [Actinomycetota bacterium]|nr:L-aspartate oxidase [Actinomycetota bacterium]